MGVAFLCYHAVMKEQRIKWVIMIRLGDFKGNVI